MGRSTLGVLATVLLFAAIAPDPGEAFWACQADFVAGHAMAIFNQRCETEFAMQEDSFFVGWYPVDGSAPSSPSVARTLCCVGLGFSLGQEDVTCLNPSGEDKALKSFQADLDAAIPADFNCIDYASKLTNFGTTAQVLSRDQYLKFTEQYLRRVGKREDMVPRVFGNGMFALVERVLESRPPPQESWKNEIIVTKTSASVDGTGIYKRFFCCLISSTQHGPPDLMGCVTKNTATPAILDAMTRSETPRTPQMYCHDKSQIPEYRPVKTQIDSQRYTSLMGEVGLPAPAFKLEVYGDVGPNANEQVAVPQSMSLQAEFMSVPQAPEKWETPHLVPHGGCNGDSYHQLDRPLKYDRRSNNPFEGLVVGLRPTSESSVAVVNEEIISQIRLRYIGEMTLRAFIRPLMCDKALFLDAPDLTLRRKAEAVALKYNRMSEFDYTSRIGLIRDYLPTDGDDEEMKLYADKGEDSTTCREFVSDIMKVQALERKSVDRSVWEETIRSEALLSWTCDQGRYGDGVCDCTCGAWDPDCNPTSSDEKLTFDNAPSRTSCPHPSMRCGPLGCTSRPWLPLDKVHSSKHPVEKPRDTIQYSSKVKAPKV